MFARSYSMKAFNIEENTIWLIQNPAWMILKKPILILLIIGSIYFMLLDELMMGSAQSSMGPFNLGWYGIISSMINGCNLIMTQLMMPKLHFYFGFQSFPMFFFLWSMISYSIMYPFYLMNLMFSLVLMIMISGLSMLFIILSAFSGNSKYSMLGCIRMMSQLMSFELMWTTMLSYIIWTLNEMSIVGFLILLIFMYLIWLVNKGMKELMNE